MVIIIINIIDVIKYKAEEENLANNQLIMQKQMIFEEEIRNRKVKMWKTSFNKS